MATAPIDRLVAAFRDRFGQDPEWIGEAPGRVNLIGEHTDYNDGLVLPVAIDRSTLVVAGPAAGSASRVWSLDVGEESPFETSQPQRECEYPWSNYVRGVAWAFACAGLAVPPLKLAIASRVPMGAGLSSSAALEVAVAAVIAAAGGLSIPPKEMALLAHQAESQFVGVPCGIMDQFASCLGAEGHALLIDCRTQLYERVPMELDQVGLSLVVVDSGVSRKLAGSAYRQRREECEQAATSLQALLRRDVRALRDVGEQDLDRYGTRLPELLLRRARHVVSENARVLRCVDALRGRRFDEVGSLFAASHRSLRDDFEVSCPELDLLVDLASRTSGVLGARLTGAGFGGCTINVVETRALAEFQSRVLAEYQNATGKTPRMYVCRAAHGATAMKM